MSIYAVVVVAVVGSLSSFDRFMCTSARGGGCYNWMSTDVSVICRGAEAAVAEASGADGDTTEV